MKKIVKENGSVYADQHRWASLGELIEHLGASSVFVLVDNNTRTHCLPLAQQQLLGNIDFELLEIPSGEEHKTLSSCLKLWETLSQRGADRKSLLINLGGGVVTDLGGFVACAYRRGIRFINIPTTLLAMVDASVGGKTGVDLGVLKNQIGIIRNPQAVLIDPQFLSTLPADEFRSGTAEVIKHGCISTKSYTDRSFELSLDQSAVLLDMIWESIVLKDGIINQDPLEDGIRKALNFGHTLGHAIESYRLSSQLPNLLHGEAIAIGMILELYLSAVLLDFPKEETDQIAQRIVALFGKEAFEAPAIEAIIELLIHDKKNSHGQVLFVLLEDYGKPRFNQTVNNDLIRDAFSYYKNV